MADVVQKAKPKSPYTDRLNPRYASNVTAEQKRREAEAFEALNTFIRKHNGWVTSPPGKVLRVEAMAGSPLPAKLRELGYNVAERGSVTRVTGAPSISPKTERLTKTVPSAFCEMDVLEIRLDGK
jgi:hypothetical protein